jgi:hypothetical protein
MQVLIQRLRGKERVESTTYMTQELSSERTISLQNNMALQHATTTMTSLLPKDEISTRNTGFVNIVQSITPGSNTSKININTSD